MASSCRLTATQYEHGRSPYDLQAPVGSSPPTPRAIINYSFLRASYSRIYSGFLCHSSKATSTGMVSLVLFVTTLPPLPSQLRFWSRETRSLPALRRENPNCDGTFLSCCHVDRTGYVIQLLIRISQSRPSKCFMYGSCTRSSPMSLISWTISSNLVLKSSGCALSPPSLPPVGREPRFLLASRILGKFKVRYCFRFELGPTRHSWSGHIMRIATMRNSGSPRATCVRKLSARTYSGCLHAASFRNSAKKDTISFDSFEW